MLAGNGKKLHGKKTEFDSLCLVDTGFSSLQKNPDLPNQPAAG